MERLKGKEGRRNKGNDDEVFYEREEERKE